MDVTLYIMCSALSQTIMTIITRCGRGFDYAVPEKKKKNDKWLEKRC